MQMDSVEEKTYILIIINEICVSDESLFLKNCSADFDDTFTQARY